MEKQYSINKERLSDLIRKYPHCGFENAVLSNPYNKKELLCLDVGNIEYVAKQEGVSPLELIEGLLLKEAPLVVNGSFEDLVKELITPKKEEE